MRHGVKLNRLGRKTAHRKALMMNLANQLIEHKRIVTTLAKAKALRVYVEPLLTRSKTDDTHNRRMVFSYLQSKETIIELFSTVSEKIASRPGGYTRIIKMQPRIGDAAEMALIELVDFNDVYKAAPVADEKKKTRRSRATAAKTTAPKAENNNAEAAATPVAIVEDTVAVEEAPVVEEVTEEVAPVAEAEVVAETPAEVVEEVTPVVEAEVVAETPAPVVEEVAPVAEAKADNLQLIEGIGPKIAEILNSKGINTFAQLASTNTADVKAMLEEAGPSFAGKDPGTWGQQAQMAADGKMDELKAWQDELNGGKA